MSFLPLLAQAASPATPDMPQNAFILAIVALGVCIPITAIVMGIRYAMRDREMQHTERLKAIERGFLLDEVEEEQRFRQGIMRLAFGIGIALPAGVVLAAAIGAANMPGNSSMNVFLIWTGAASVGIAGVASGAWLANAAITRLRPSSRTSAHETTTYPRGYEAAQPMMNR